MVYKRFISKGTTMQGSGGAPFAQITANLNQNQYSEFSIIIDGTSIIKPEYSALKKMAREITPAFNVPGAKGIFICTGMHVLRYQSRVFAKSDGEGQITTPVVNIGGSFFAESNEEEKQYLVARQLTQLFKQSYKDTATIIRDLQLVVSESNMQNMESQARAYTPEEGLLFVLKRQPTFDEIIKNQSNPQSYMDSLQTKILITEDQKTLLNTITDQKLTDVPLQVTTTDVPPEEEARRRGFIKPSLKATPQINVKG